MLQERPDDAAHWRQRLEQLESLPEEHHNDHTQLWEKLHGRLQEPARNTATKWYWLAAACLLLVFMLPLININRQHLVSKSKAVHTQQKTGKPEQPVVVKQTLPPIQRSVDKQHVATTHSKNKKQGRNLKPASPGLSAGIKLEAPLVLPAAPGLIIDFNRDTVLVASSKPEKKKLRVVHINELEQPLLENIQSGSKQATAAFQKQRSRLLQASDFEFGSNTSEEILKIKLSPSN